MLCSGRVYYEHKHVIFLRVQQEYKNISNKSWARTFVCADDFQSALPFICHKYWAVVRANRKFGTFVM